MQAGNHKKLDVLSCDTKTLRSTLRRTAFMRLTLPDHSPSRAGDSSAVKHLPSTHEPWVQLPALKKRLLKLMLEDIF